LLPQITLSPNSPESPEIFTTDWEYKKINI